LVTARHDNSYKSPGCTRRCLGGKPRLHQAFYEVVTVFVFDIDNVGSETIQTEIGPRHENGLDVGLSFVHAIELCVGRC
jgi:hypothetical protein